MDKRKEEKLGDKLQRGIDLAYRRLIEQKQREDGELIYSVKGKIIRVRARDIKLEQQP